MSFQETLVNRPRATLRAEGAELAVEALGFEFPEALDDFNAQWLVARVTWRGAAGQLACEGPVFMIDELAAWGQIAIAQDERVEATFVEPNVRYACMAKDASEERIVRLGLLHESKSGNTHVETRMTVTSAELAAFGRALVDMARVLRTRRVRLRVPRRLGRGGDGTGGAAAEVS